MTTRWFITAAGCFLLVAIIAGRRCGLAPSNGGNKVGMHSDAGTRVKLNPTGLYYYEGDNSLRLTAELGEDAKGAFYYVHVWTPTTWVREMPEWCRHRREEVMADIRRLTADRRIKWIDAD
jgi:hypothetical protein